MNQPQKEELWWNYCNVILEWMESRMDLNKNCISSNGKKRILNNQFQALMHNFDAQNYVFAKKTIGYQTPY